MQLNPELEEAFSRQVTLELHSSLAYLQLSADFAARNLTGMAAWMRIQSEEERGHALRFLEFALDRGNQVRIGALEPQVPLSGGAVEAFREALAQEQRVSESIRSLYRLAAQHGDVDSFPLLQVFLTEQVEEEASVGEILAHLEMIEGDGTALLMLDRELGTRTPEAE
jgi:ferritin